MKNLKFSTLVKKIASTNKSKLSSNQMYLKVLKAKGYDVTKTSIKDIMINKNIPLYTTIDRLTRNYYNS